MDASIRSVVASKGWSVTDREEQDSQPNDTTRRGRYNGTSGEFRIMGDAALVDDPIQGPWQRCLPSTSLKFMDTSSGR